MKDIKIDSGALAQLFKDTGNGFQYQEGPYLLAPFEVGTSCKVGSRFARTYGSDWWMTSTVKGIESTEVIEGLTHIIFNTMNSRYKLIVGEELNDE